MEYKNCWTPCRTPSAPPCGSCIRVECSGTYSRGPRIRKCSLTPARDSEPPAARRPPPPRTSYRWLAPKTRRDDQPTRQRLWASSPPPHRVPCGSSSPASSSLSPRATTVTMWPLAQRPGAGLSPAGVPAVEHHGQSTVQRLWNRDDRTPRRLLWSCGRRGRRRRRPAHGRTPTRHSSCALTAAGIFWRTTSALLPAATSAASGKVTFDMLWPAGAGNGRKAPPCARTAPA